MTVYSLYVKEHCITGLKYLGYTKIDPLKYRGSGTYWLRHLHIHGIKHNTMILLQTTEKEEIKEWGRYYSNLWNIINSKDELGKKCWANLRIEEGNGGPGYLFSAEDRKKISEKSKKSWLNIESRTKRIASIKRALNSPDVKAKISAMSKYILSKPEIKAKLKESSRKTWANLDLRKKQSIIQLEAQNRKETKEKKIIRAINSWKNEEVRIARIIGKTDQKIYTFRNNNTGEILYGTRTDLISKYNLCRNQLSKVITKKAKSSKGWSLV